jgi:hypothetical protein
MNVCVRIYPCWQACLTRACHSCSPVIHILEPATTVHSAYNLGHLLRGDPTPRGLLYVVGCLLPIMGVWNLKLYYDCRYFVGNDLWHRGLEVAKLVCLATAVLNIRPTSVLSRPAEFPDMFHFCLGVTGAYVVMHVRYLEVLYCQWAGMSGLYPEAFWASRRDLVWTGAQLALYMAATIYAGLSYYGGLGGSEQYNYGNSSSSNATNSSNSLLGNVTAHRYLAQVTSQTSNYAAEDDTPIILGIVGNLVGQLLMTFIVIFVLSPRWRKVPLQR